MSELRWPMDSPVADVLSEQSVEREWVEVREWDDPQATTAGWIPRDALEAMGIDCSVLDEQDTLWFTREQVEQIRQHGEWEPQDLPSGATMQKVSQPDVRLGGAALDLAEPEVS